jgi:glycosyltransferase involved in cell wall biosynthesis
VGDDAFARVPPEALGQARVAEDLLEPRSELGNVPGLDEEARDAVLDHLGHAADPARDDRRARRHRLDRREAEQLGDGDVTSVAGPVNRRHRQHPGGAVKSRQIGLRDRAKEVDAAPCRQPPEETGIVALRRAGVVAARAGDAQLGSVRERLDEAIDALVRRQPPDEEDAAARFGGGRRHEPLDVGAAVDHSCAGSGQVELARRIGRHGEKALVQPRKQAAPIPAGEPVVCDDRRDAAGTCDERGDLARRAAQVMHMDDIRAGDRAWETERERVRRMASHERERPDDAVTKPAGIAPTSGPRAEGDELTLDMSGERPAELEGIALTAPEDAGRAEAGRGHVDDPHLRLPLVTLGDPRRLSGGYLYHRRMADAAPRHRARIVFVSFPERPFPLPAASGPAVLRTSLRRPADAVLLDSIAAAFAAPVLLMRRYDVPVIGILHQPPGGIDHGAVRAAAQAPLDGLAWRRARLLIAASDHLAEQLVEAGIPGSRIRVVPPGRDVAPAESAPVAGGRERPGVAFLAVANWLPRKGILELLDAFAQLPPSTGVLHLAGDESVDRRYAGRVRSRLREPDLAGRVVVHGRLPLEEVAARYRTADVFVLAAYREPYGTVWGEAMAAGLPVVGWSAGNLPYLAEHEREGLLVPPGDVAALSNALSRLAIDGDLRARLGAAAKRRAVARPTWDETAAQFFGVIREALSGP